MSKAKHRNSMIDTDELGWFRHQLRDWSEGRLRSFPWRGDDMTFYEVFIAEMFLRRTQAEVVAEVLPKFLERYPTMSALREADPEQLADIIRPLGLQNLRSQALLEIVDAAESGLPQSVERLQALPQVGHYVAAATMCFATGEPVPIIDRNVDRVYQRFLGERWREADDEGRLALAEAALDVQAPRRHNLALLDFAAAVCTAREPDCMSCPMAPRCASVST